MIFYFYFFTNRGSPIENLLELGTYNYLYFYFSFNYITKIFLHIFDQIFIFLLFLFLLFLESVSIGHSFISVILLVVFCVVMKVFDQLYRLAASRSIRWSVTINFVVKVVMESHGDGRMVEAEGKANLQ